MGNDVSNKKEEKIGNSAILEYSNGERYIGEVGNGVRDGYGTYYYQNGEKYEGQWVKNTKNGKRNSNLFVLFYFLFTHSFL